MVAQIGVGECVGGMVGFLGGVGQLLGVGG